MSNVLFGDIVWWYCSDCGAEGQCDSDYVAHKEADEHECITDDDEGNQ